MVSIVILFLAGLVCVIGALIALYVLLRNKSSEDFVFFCIIGILICIGGAAWCTTEAVKRADIYDKSNK